MSIIDKAYVESACGEQQAKGVARALLEEREEALAKVRELQEIVALLVDQGGLEFHDEAGLCPEDDTCDCRVARRINAAMKGYDESRRP